MSKRREQEAQVRIQVMYRVSAQPQTYDAKKDRVGDESVEHDMELKSVLTLIYPSSIARSNFLERLSVSLTKIEARKYKQNSFSSRFCLL